MNIAVIGTSGHLNYVNEGLAQLPSARCVGLAPGGPDEELSSCFIEKHSGMKVYDEVEQMLDDFHPHVVVINPHFHRHALWTEVCLQRGLHVFCEKPLALDMDSLESVKAAAVESRARLGLMMGYRYDPAFYAAYQAVRGGRIGEVVHVTAQKSYRNGPKPAWQHDRRRYGGTISWVGSHALDWIAWLCPDKPIERCVAHDCLLYNRNNGDMASSAYVGFDFESGGQASVSIDYLRPKGAPGHGDDRLRVAGSKGVVEVIFGQATILDDEGLHELEQPPQPPIFADFVGAIEEGRPFRQSHDEIWRMSEMCIVAQQAADSRQSIRRKL